MNYNKQSAFYWEIADVDESFVVLTPSSVSAANPVGSNASSSTATGAASVRQCK